MDFEFVRGDTTVLKFQLKDKNGAILNLTDTDRLYFTVKKTPKDKKAVIQKRLGNGIEHKDDDFYYITIHSEDTANLNYGDYGYDIEIKAENGVVKTLVIGTMTLTEEYTFKGDEI